MNAFLAGTRLGRLTGNGDAARETVRLSALTLGTLVLEMTWCLGLTALGTSQAEPNVEY